MDQVEPEIRALLAEWPTMPAPVIAERIGWQRGMTVLKDRVRELRPSFSPPDPVSRTMYQPGDLAQCDLWFPPADVPLGFGQLGRPPVLVMVSGYSRVINAVMSSPGQVSPDPEPEVVVAAGGDGFAVASHARGPSRLGNSRTGSG
ncbi:hypothetical protein OOZ19_02610 [Saccharopolyspora sp. NFXS83]|uniref:hypothetical protein n=1 Tax=Saccharopolyspora sp. NFXS83 TaxID=2993560 RepID=UPI00224A8D90|nr:hypothetical protein [Saccharopolyspora sp. NFXS83]MCX2729119.1 hypothetical protein [Saccharopolyspora sp. NFXS83]